LRELLLEQFQRLRIICDKARERANHVFDLRYVRIPLVNERWRAMLLARDSEAFHVIGHRVRRRELFAAEPAFGRPGQFMPENVATDF
jgi:hypothetical protein